MDIWGYVWSRSLREGEHCLAMPCFGALCLYHLSPSYPVFMLLQINAQNRLLKDGIWPKKSVLELSKIQLESLQDSSNTMKLSFPKLLHFVWTGRGCRDLPNCKNDFSFNGRQQEGKWMVQTTGRSAGDLLSCCAFTLLEQRLEHLGP